MRWQNANATDPFARAKTAKVSLLHSVCLKPSSRRQRPRDCLRRRGTIGFQSDKGGDMSERDRRLVVEFRLERLRSQTAVVRALVDHVEHLSRARDADATADRLIEEIARLGCRLLETAETLAEWQHPEDSGVFARPASAAPVIALPVECQPE